MHISSLRTYVNNSLNDWTRLRAFTMDHRTGHFPIAQAHFTVSGLLLATANTPPLKPPAIIQGPEGTLRCSLPYDKSPFFPVIGVYELPEVFPPADHNYELQVWGDRGWFSLDVYQGLISVPDGWTRSSYTQYTGMPITEKQLERLKQGLIGPW